MYCLCLPSVLPLSDGYLIAWSDKPDGVSSHKWWTNLQTKASCQLHARLMTGQSTPGQTGCPWHLQACPLCYSYIKGAGTSTLQYIFNRVRKQDCNLTRLKILIHTKTYKYKYRYQYQSVLILMSVYVCTYTYTIPYIVMCLVYLKWIVSISEIIVSTTYKLMSYLVMFSL